MVLDQLDDLPGFRDEAFRQGERFLHVVRNGRASAHRCSCTVVDRDDGAPCLVGAIGSTARMPKRHGERLLDDAVLALDTAARTDFAHGDGAGAPRSLLAAYEEDDADILALLRQNVGAKRRAEALPVFPRGVRLAGPRTRLRLARRLAHGGRCESGVGGRQHAAAGDAGGTGEVSSGVPEAPAIILLERGAWQGAWRCMTIG